MATNIPIKDLDKFGEITEIESADMASNDTDFELINTGNELLVISNQSGASATVTLLAVNAQHSNRATNVVYTIADGEIRPIGPLNTNNFNSEGKAKLTVAAAHADLKMYAVRR